MDNAIKIDTPEGVEIAFDIAGPVVRGCAWLVDFSIRAFLYIAIAMAFSSLLAIDNSAVIAGLMSILAFSLEWLYPALFEGFTSSSPGKRLFGLYVLQEDGTPLTWSSAVIRNFLRAVDFLPLFYMTGLITMIVSQRFQRLGDLAGGTLVVYTPVTRNKQEIESIESQPTPTGFKLEEKLAIVNFAERCNGLSEDRQIELANILYPLTEKKGQQAVVTLKAWANYITRGNNHA